MQIGEECTVARSYHSARGSWYEGPSQTSQRVKLHRTRVVSDKLMNRKKTLNNVRSNKDVLETEGARDNRITY
jgi:hypothetical protein